MGQKDLIAKNYLSNPVKFADLMNFAIFGGEQRIRPEQLQPCDTAKIYSVERNELEPDNESLLSELYRDLQRAFVMEDERRRYVLLAIEHQSNIHYAMPERVMLYDAAEYQRQVKEISARHKGEYTGNFWKGEKLIPSITVVLYLGAKRWDGPRDILDLFDLEGFPEQLAGYVTPYPIHLISPMEMTNAEIRRFSTDLQQVFLFIKHQHDKKELADVMREDPGFRNMDAETARVISLVTGTKLTVSENEEGGKIDMCKAIQDMMDDARAEGLTAGRAEGLLEGQRSQLCSSVLGCHRAGFSFDTISRVLSIPVAEVMSIIAAAEAK